MALSRGYTVVGARHHKAKKSKIVRVVRFLALHRGPTRVLARKIKELFVSYAVWPYIGGKPE